MGEKSREDRGGDWDGAMFPQCASRLLTSGSGPAGLGRIDFFLKPVCGIWFQPPWETKHHMEMPAISWPLTTFRPEPHHAEM
jgi:hypothetical protein